MAGAGNFGNATIQIEPHEGATGTEKVIWLPEFGVLRIPVPPGTANGSTIWVQSAFGVPVAVTVQVVKVSRRLTVKQQFLVYGTAVVLVVGGCVGAGVFALRGQNKPAASPARILDATPSPIAPQASATQASATQATATEYAALLAAADTAIGADFRRLNTNHPESAAPQVVQTIDDQVAKLRAVQPPAAAAATHARLTQELASLGELVSAISSDQDKPACPAAATTPFGTLLASGWAGRIHQDSLALAKADPTFVFGKFLPAAPKVITTRPANGSFVKKATKHGLGKLKIKNGGSDMAISLVPARGKKTPVFTVYVRGKSTYTVTRVNPGNYLIYYAAGAGWNPSRKGFTSKCEFSKFDDTFLFKGYPIIDTWQITMTPVLGGNATTSDVDPSAFPSG
jgi:hypothetical protein